MVSGQWAVGSGQWAVGSGQWAVVYTQKIQMYNSINQVHGYTVLEIISPQDVIENEGQIF